MPIKEIGSFSLSYMQILDEQGNLDKELEPDLTDDQLLSLYRYMVIAREVDQRQLKMQRQGRIGTFPPSTGQEAVACGAVLAMQKQDWYVDAYRTLGGRLMRGEKINTQLTLWAGWEEGYLDNNSSRTLPNTVVLGSQLPIATGIGYAMKLKGETDSCVVTFFGDGSSSEGDTHEALNFASVWQIPVVFILVNNQWAISTPKRFQTNAKTYAQRCIGYDMPGIQVDGNDPLAMYQATKEALDRGRDGGGPSLIEAVTYRMMMHTTADDPTRYRTHDEEEEWKKRDPIDRMRLYLREKNLWDDTKEQALQDETVELVANEVKIFEENSKFPPDAPFDFVYGTTHQELEDQRQDFLRNLQLDGDSHG
jgi:pyruvate dehydrogenase E1 component alpha subunit